MMALKALLAACGLLSCAALAGAQSASFLGSRHTELEQQPIGDGCVGGESHDDGIPEDGLGWNPDQVSIGRYVDRFDPISLPFTYEKVCLCWLRNGDDTELVYHLEIFDDDGVAGSPGTLLGTVQTVASQVPDTLPGAFYTVDLKPLALRVDEGSVYIGARWDPSRERGFFLCGDESLTTPRHVGFGQINRGAFLPTLALQPGYRSLVLRATGIGAPLVQLAGQRATDGCAVPTTGRNSIPEPGEQLILELELEARFGSFQELGGRVSCPAELSTEEARGYWGMIGDGQTGISSPFALELEPDPALCGRTFTCQLSIDNPSGGAPFLFSLQQPIGQRLRPVVPVALPDDDIDGFRSTLELSEDVVLRDVDVRLEIDHSFVGDLMVFLLGPGGTVRRLLDRPGTPPGFFGCSDDDLRIVFDDQASLIAEELEGRCEGSQPWYDGRVQPVDPLDVFVGTPARGDWTLWVIDAAGGDSGTLVDWELITDPPLEERCQPCQVPGAAPGTIVAIPALSGWGWALFAGVLLLSGGVILAYRRSS